MTRSWAVKGYSAGFGLTGCHIRCAQSVVVKSMLRQHRSSDQYSYGEARRHRTGYHDIFAIRCSGNFDYATDGYWPMSAGSIWAERSGNASSSDSYSRDGTVITAENTVLAGDPTTIFPVIIPPTTITKDQCKNGGWKTFTTLAQIRASA